MFHISETAVPPSLHWRPSGAPWLRAHIVDESLNGDERRAEASAPAQEAEGEAARERDVETAPPGSGLAILGFLFTGTVGLGNEEGVARTEPLRGWGRVLGVLVIAAFLVAIVVVTVVFGLPR